VPFPLPETAEYRSAPTIPRTLHPTPGERPRDAARREAGSRSRDGASEQDKR
jgi:hypothetical protein